MATATKHPDSAVEDEFNETGDEERGGDLVSLADREGKTIDELAEERAQNGDREPPEPPKPVPPSQLAIPGTRDKITATIGGAKPTDSEMRLLGGRRPIVGEFYKGDDAVFLVSAKVRAVELVDVDDEWGNVQRTVRAHKARMHWIRHATAEALMRELVSMGLDRAGVGVLFDEVESAG